MNKRFLNYSREFSKGDAHVAVVPAKGWELEEVGE